MAAPRAPNSLTACSNCSAARSGNCRRDEKDRRSVGMGLAPFGELFIVKLDDLAREVHGLPHDQKPFMLST